MSGPSIHHFRAFREPDVFVEDGFIKRAKEWRRTHGSAYSPADHITELLNAIKSVYSEEDAVQFVREWGFLGLTPRQGFLETKRTKAQGIIDYLYSIRYPERSFPENYFLEGLTDGEIEDYEKIADDVIENLNKRNESSGLFYSRTNRKVNPNYNQGNIYILSSGESIEGIINKANYIRDLAQIKYLLRLYDEDPYIADYEVDEWIKTIPYILSYMCDSYEDIMSNLEKFFPLSERLKRENISPLRNYLDSILGFRMRHFGATQNLWVELTPKGKPKIMFTGLAKFIEYVILSESWTYPQICQDPKCNKLFFPSREGQRYCPPLPREKRSKCEQRHGQQLRRETKKKAHQI